jgi:hypothetical protein
MRVFAFAIAITIALFSRFGHRRKLFVAAGQPAMRCYRHLDKRPPTTQDVLPQRRVSNNSIECGVFDLPDHARAFRVRDESRDFAMLGRWQLGKATQKIAPLLFDSDGLSVVDLD